MNTAAIHFYSLAALILIAALYSWTSRINQFFYFGCTVDEGFRQSDAARTIRGRYLVWTVAGFMLSLVVWYGVPVKKPMGAMFLPLFTIFVLHLAAWGRANRETRNARRENPQQPGVESAVREAPLLEIPSMPSVKTVLTPVVCAVLSYPVAVMILARRTGLVAAPSVLAKRFDSAQMAMLLGFSLGLMMAIPMLLMLRRVTRQRSALAVHVQNSLHYLAWGGFLVLLMTLVCALDDFPLSLTWVRFCMSVFLVGTLLLLLWRTLKAKQFVPHPVEMQGDENWIWGMFYCNHQDPALFVQNRGTAGYTLNFSRGLAWPLVILYFGSLLALIVMEYLR